MRFFVKIQTPGECFPFLDPRKKSLASSLTQTVSFSPERKTEWQRRGTRPSTEFNATDPHDSIGSHHVWSGVYIKEPVTAVAKLWDLRRTH